MNIVENFDLYAPRLVNKKELFCAGHRACQGCGEVLAVRLMCKALGENTVIASATGCMEIVSSMFPTTAWEVPWIHVAFENAAAVASGVEVGLKALRKKGRIDDRYVKVVGMAGDGGTMDIGLQALSGAMERGHDMLFVCFDNEAYMNTGIQRSSGTPMGASTTTAPAGKISFGQKTWKKNMPEIMVAHNVPYVATACPSYPLDFIRKVEKAKKIKGPSYIHCFSVCPTGWRSPSHLTVALGRMVVETGIFPLYEVENGKYKISAEMPKKLKPIKDYFKSQGRFRHLAEHEIKMIQSRVESEYNKLLDKVKCLKAWN
ncbi:MAG: pyruvate ferredoxin oxidoreductase [Deltaproteobacteria bacterium RBG_16_44_11]|jgi:pyruvate ferredoxin oxidoreductase beta subunit|nr:MAG: pyruvate ferredoxin oxidoreductase [Deltaproteobacteria bacterium RBG_16_44_11]